jgi:hypothetical protein
LTWQGNQAVLEFNGTSISVHGSTWDNHCPYSCEIYVQSWCRRTFAEWRVTATWKRQSESVKVLTLPDQIDNAAPVEKDGWSADRKYLVELAAATNLEAGRPHTIVRSSARRRPAESYDRPADYARAVMRSLRAALM